VKLYYTTLGATYPKSLLAPPLCALETLFKDVFCLDS